MRKFIFKISVYFMAILGILIIAFLINKYAVLKMGMIEYKHKETLVIGASRTAWSVDDRIANKLMNVSSNGDGLIYSFVKLKLFTEHNPQIDRVLLCFDNRTLDSLIVERNYNSNSLRRRLPIYSYFVSGEEFSDMVGKDYYSVFKTSVKVPQHSLQVIKTALLSKNPRPKDLRFGGYNRISRHLNNDSIKKFTANDTLRGYTISKKEVRYLNNIVDYCKEKNLELIFVNPPLHPVMYHSTRYQEGKKYFDNFVNQNLSEIKYLDYSTEFLPDSCYADLIHLNHQGAKIFTERLKSELNK